MRRPSFPVGILAVLACVASLGAGVPATTQSGRAVGSAYGKAVTAADIGLTAPVDVTVRFDARDDAKWNLMGRICSAFGKPVLDRFVAEKKIDATAGEVEAFRKEERKRNERDLREREDRLTKVKADLASPGLRADDHAKLEKERRMLETIIRALRDLAKAGGSDDMARQFIVAWKIERELHRTYGGRVIFQQAGLEALDGRRRLFEQAERAGDLKFEDAGVRHLFYYYWVNMKHGEVDEKLIEWAWFLGDGAK